MDPFVSSGEDDDKEGGEHCKDKGDYAEKEIPHIGEVTGANKPATNLKYNFYSFHNPKEYLGGSNAIVVEQGPYNLRKYSVAYNVAQSSSTLTAASQPDPKGTLEYSTANAYLVLDKDVKATWNLQRNADFSLLVSAKRVLANHLSMTDIVRNFSPDYLSFLGAMNDEVNMILSLECTA